MTVAVAAGFGQAGSRPALPIGGRRTRRGQTQCGPRPTALRGCGGEVISTGVSSSLKTRSLDAMADWRMLYLSLRSWIGRKKRCAYCMKATSTPKRDGAAKDAHAAEPDDHGNGHAGKDFHHRVVERVGHDGVFEGVHVLGVDAVKAAVGALFAVEKLQHHHAGDVLLQIRVDAGNGGADAAVRVAHRLAKDHGRPEDQRQHGKGDQREPPAHPQHDDDDSGEHEDVFKNRHHAGGKHFVQRVNVRGDAGDQAADGVLVVEPDVHVLQVAEDLAAQIEHHLLAGPLHEIRLRIFQAKADQQQRKIEEPQLGDADQRLGAENGIKKPSGCGRWPRRDICRWRSW